MITAIDGNRMARMGRGGATALATAAIGSFIAGTIATMLVAFFAPWIVDIAVQLGPQDYLALMVVAFLTVSALVGSSPLRGLIAMAVGSRSPSSASTSRAASSASRSACSRCSTASTPSC